MRRLFYKGILADTIEIGGADAHHLMHVMRAKPGQEVIVVDDENQVARMEMTAFTSDTVTVTMKLVERLDADTESPIRLVLAVCLLKADKMDFVVQKAVELGVNCIVPVASHNCVVRYDSKKAAQRQQRGQAVADRRNEQRRQQVAQFLPQPQRQPCHAQAGRRAAKQPEQQQIRQRDTFRYSLQLRNAHRRGQQRGQTVIPQDLPQMRQTRSESDPCRNERALPQLCFRGIFPTQRRGCQNLIHAAFAFHGE